MIVKYLYVLPILQWLRGLGACPAKIMTLEVTFLLTNFNSTASYLNS